MTVVAPYILNGGKVEPYISLTEYKFSATASAIDFSNLVANGSQAANDRSLYELIVRASSKIDVFCFGKYGSLNATSSTQNGRTRIDRFGRLKVSPTFKPIIAVTDFQYGLQMGDNWSTPLTPYNCWIEEESIIFQANGANSVNAVAGMQALSYILQKSNSGEYYCTYTYQNGWPNSFTTSTSDVGDQSLNLVDATGRYPGQFSTIWDGMNDEYIQVAEDYVPGNLTLTLASPLQYKHGTGVNVSSIPAVVKQACIHFVTAMIKQRGQGGIVLNEMGADTMVSGKVEMSAEDEIAGYNLLDEFKTVWGRV